MSAQKYKFAASVDSWVGESKKRCDAVLRASVQDLIEVAQKPTETGGKMRVDTGFLRASGQLSLTGMPTGPGRPATDGGMHAWTDPTGQITNAKSGDTLYFGWTANYAIYRELYDGFLISAIQDWQEIVNKHVRRLNARSAFRIGNK